MRKFAFTVFAMLVSLNFSAKTALADTTTVQKPSSVDQAYVDGDPKTHAAALSDIIDVHVVNLKGLLGGTPENGVKQIRLFINGLEIEGTAPVGWYINGDDGYLKFFLQRTDANDKTWSLLLGYPEFGPAFFDLPVSISTGVTTHSPVPTDVDNDKKFKFVRIDPSWLIGCMVLVLVYFAMLYWCIAKKNMLRDSPPDLTPLGIPGLAVGKAPFSLGKVQMAFWFSIILVSYIFIWLITDDYELLNSGTLVLIGIGAGTSLGAISIDNNKAQGTISKIQDLQAQQSSLTQATAQLTPLLAEAGTAEKITYNNFLSSQLTSNIDKLVKSLKVGKQNFLNDILTDENGISFHRLQMAVFTLVLGMIFIYTVWAELTMPSFSPTLLTMQGITAGTYLGFKVPEKQA